MWLESLVNLKKDERFPPEWEQEVAEIYVNERKIIRPNTTITTAITYFLLFMLVTSILIWFVKYIIMTVGIIAYLPSNVQTFCYEYPFLSNTILCAIIVFVELIFCFKYMAIGAVKLYQHYAPEEIRRRCLFMPTCSEYAILAIRKYGGVIGLLKTYFRLVYLCRGNIYRIHYP